jgi:hypothetical protein
VCCLFSSGLFPASEFYMPTFRNTLFCHHNQVGVHLPAYEDGTECSETSAYKIQTLRNYPEEYIQRSTLCHHSGLLRHLTFTLCKRLAKLLAPALFSQLLTYLLTYLLTPRSRVLLEKLTVNFAASQEIPRIYGTRKLLTVPTSARHLSLS